MTILSNTIDIKDEDHFQLFPRHWHKCCPSQSVGSSWEEVKGWDPPKLAEDPWTIRNPFVSGSEKIEHSWSMLIVGFPFLDEPCHLIAGPIFGVKHFGCSLWTRLSERMAGTSDVRRFPWGTSYKGTLTADSILSEFQVLTLCHPGTFQNLGTLAAVFTHCPTGKWWVVDPCVSATPTHLVLFLYQTYLCLCVLRLFPCKFPSPNETVSKQCNPKFASWWSIWAILSWAQMFQCFRGRRSGA